MFWLMFCQVAILQALILWRKISFKTRIHNFTDIIGTHKIRAIQNTDIQKHTGYLVCLFLCQKSTLSLFYSKEDKKMFACFQGSYLSSEQAARHDCTTQNWQKCCYLETFLLLLGIIISIPLLESCSPHAHPIACYS